jgi:hypothetical protein
VTTAFVRQAAAQHLGAREQPLVVYRPFVGGVGVVLVRLLIGQDSLKPPGK